MDVRDAESNERVKRESRDAIVERKCQFGTKHGNEIATFFSFILRKKLICLWLFSIG